MAKVRAVWLETTSHEAIVEIGDETYTGSEEQDLEILSKVGELENTCTGLRGREVETVNQLRAGADVPADITAPAYEPEF